MSATLVTRRRVWCSLIAAFAIVVLFAALSVDTDDYPETFSTLASTAKDKISTFHKASASALCDANSTSKEVSQKSDEADGASPKKVADSSEDQKVIAAFRENSSYPHPSDIFPKPPPGDDDEYVAFCLMVKDTTDGLKENLMHHYWHLGIRRFYVMDDHSDPPLSERQAPGGWGIPDSSITFRHLTEDESHRGQVPKTGWCFEDHGHKHTWMAVFDADELLEMRNHDPNRNMNGKKKDETLVEFLKSFEHKEGVGAVSINWLSHVGGDMTDMPVAGGWRKNFITCLDRSEESTKITNGNRNIKSIARTAAVKEGGAIHKFTLKKGFMHVDEHGEGNPFKVDHWSRIPVTWDRIALHHYGYLSLAHWKEKNRLGNAGGRHRTYEAYKEVVDGPKEPCVHLATWSP